MFRRGFFILRGVPVKSSFFSRRKFVASATLLGLLLITNSPLLAGTTKRRLSNGGRLLDHIGGNRPGTESDCKNFDNPQCRWVVTSLPIDNKLYVRLCNIFSKEYLDIHGSKPSYPMMSPDKGESATLWQCIDAKNGYFHLKNAYNGLFLATTNDGKTELVQRGGVPGTFWIYK